MGRRRYSTKTAQLGSVQAHRIGCVCHWKKAPRSNDQMMGAEASKENAWAYQKYWNWRQCGFCTYRIIGITCNRTTCCLSSVACFPLRKQLSPLVVCHKDAGRRCRLWIRRNLRKVWDATNEQDRYFGERNQLGNQTQSANRPQDRNYRNLWVWCDQLFKLGIRIPCKKSIKAK